MKFVKGALAALGLIGLVAGGVYLAMSAIDMKALMAVANANKSQGFPSPMNKIYLSVGLGALGGLLLGLGMGMPSLTRGGMRKQIASESVRRETPVVAESRHPRRTGVDPEPTQADLERDIDPAG